MSGETQRQDDAYDRATAAEAAERRAQAAAAEKGGYFVARG